MQFKKVIAFDMDDVLCDQKHGDNTIEKYLKREPIQGNIDILNELYDDGYKIVIYTARGMLSLNGNLDDINEILRPITENQLNKWGIKYHELHMGKIFYDVLIDDKALNSYKIKNSQFIKKFLGEEE